MLSCMHVRKSVPLSSTAAAPVLEGRCEHAAARAHRAEHPQSFRGGLCKHAQAELLRWAYANMRKQRFCGGLVQIRATLEPWVPCNL